MNLEHWHELDSAQYDDLAADQTASTLRNIPYVEEVLFDTDADEIQLNASVEVTAEREQNIAEQLREVSKEWSHADLTMTEVGDSYVRLELPSFIEF